MITFNELNKGTKVIIGHQPYEIVEAALMFKGRGRSVLQTKIKNLLTGSVTSKTFHPSDSFPEAIISKGTARFIYEHRGQYWFSEKKNPSQRFVLTEQQLGSQVNFLKQNQEVRIQLFDQKVIGIALPLKLTLRVLEASPGLRGDTAQSPTKTVTLETGYQLQAPLFIKENDLIEVNTQTGEYVRRVQNESP